MIPIQSAACQSCHAEAAQPRLKATSVDRSVSRANQATPADVVPGTSTAADQVPLSGSIDRMYRSRRISDSVELSREAAGRNAGNEVRHDLVARVRAQIAAGEYDSPAKIEAAADRLARHLDLLA